MTDSVSTQRWLSAGETLFRLGDTADCAYLIEDGAVDVVLDQGGTRRHIAHLSRNEMIGEMALLGDTRRSATVIAGEATRLTIITPSFLQQRMDSGDPLLRHLLRVLADRCRNLLDPTAVGAPAAASPVTADPPTPKAKDRDRAISRVRMQQSMEHALDRGEFALHYQPIMRMSDGRPAGFEALLRWQHPEIGPVSPGEFIPLAEETDLINRIGYWIVDEACRALSALEGRTGGGAAPFVTINLSSRQMEDPALMPCLQAGLARHGFAPERLKLEVTETLMMREMDPAIRLLNACRGAGMKVAIDDFGTGYSSLAYLHRLPVDTLKLDRAFIRQLHDGAASRIIARGMVSLAHELGIDVVGEGVETPVQAEALREIGADFAQGFLYSRALPLAAALEFLAR